MASIMAAVRYNIPPLFRRANKLVCGPNLASRILSLLLSLSLSLLLARLDADCTPLSLIYVPKPVVSCALPPLLSLSLPSNTHTSSCNTVSLSVPRVHASPGVHFTTLFLDFDCEINLGSRS